MTARSAATADPRLQRLLGGPELAAVRQRLRRHFERAGADAGAAADAAATRLRVDALDPAAHHALCQLTGRASHPARSMTLDLVDLDARLRQAGAAPTSANPMPPPGLFSTACASVAHCTTTSPGSKRPAAETTSSGPAVSRSGSRYQAERMIAGAWVPARQLPSTGVVAGSSP